MVILTTINFLGRDSRCSLLFPMGQIMTLVYIIVVPAFIITAHGQIHNAQQPYMCNRGSNYTKGSKFESNLNTVLNSLVQHTSQTGFNISVYGQSPDQIYGLLQCNGDATAQHCFNCSQRAITSIRQICGNAIGARVWLEDCYLRYERGKFFGLLDYSAKYRYDTQNVSSPAVFNTALDSLFKNLSSEATTSASGYASGTTIDSLSRKIYGMVQCWKDISTEDCTKCLSSTIKNIITYYGESQGVEGFIGSCKVRYETYSFFDSTAPPPFSAEPPANSNRTQINRSNRPSNKIPAVTIGLAAGSLLLLFL